MPKGSPELTKARKEEIINACSSLYDTYSFKDITMKMIGEATSFTRTSIYNYFQTKEEIFLGLLEREYRLWNADLEEMILNYAKLDRESFANLVSLSLSKRWRLLKIMSMNHYDLESSSRLENLIEFKKVYGESRRLIEEAIAKFFPFFSLEQKQRFITVFFPFMFGIYPYTYITPKQKEAMEKASANYVDRDIYHLVYDCVYSLLG